jgi:hypothetical protein
VTRNFFGFAKRLLFRNVKWVGFRCSYSVWKVSLRMFAFSQWYKIRKKNFIIREFIKLNSVLSIFKKEQGLVWFLFRGRIFWSRNVKVSRDIFIFLVCSNSLIRSLEKVNLLFLVGLVSSGLWWYNFYLWFWLCWPKKEQGSVSRSFNPDYLKFNFSSLLTDFFDACFVFPWL